MTRQRPPGTPSGGGPPARSSGPSLQGARPATPPSLAQRFQEVRSLSESLCRPLVAEDYAIQTMPDVSPTKWHLAHTTWFFETLVLAAVGQAYRPYDPQYRYLFNSYYNSIGEQYCRPKRGLLSRPTVDDVFRYRRHVDEQMIRLLERQTCNRAANRTVTVRLSKCPDPALSALSAGSAGNRSCSELDDESSILPLVELGLHHEQQHQELILTDIKHVFAANPLRAIYGGGGMSPEPGPPPELRWIDQPEGVQWIGHEGEGFAYDSETPRHRVFLEAFRIASRLITCGEYLAFMADGGYSRPELWLADGWAAAREHDWSAPLYWERDGEQWMVFTLAGRRPVDPAEPVCHVSFYEADAYSRWAGARLPLEGEWEVAARDAPLAGNFLDSGRLHPAPPEMPQRRAGDEPPAQPLQLFGDAWEWTSSAYSPYPRYRPPTGPIGEYNSKFMCNQMVLRGGSCVTPASHMRATYRNFFPPEARWQFTGIRLARYA